MKKIAIKFNKKTIIIFIILIILIILGFFIPKLNSKNNSNHDEFGLPFNLGADDWPSEPDKANTEEKQKNIYIVYKDKYELTRQFIISMEDQAEINKDKCDKQKYLILINRLKLYKYENLSSLNMTEFYLSNMKVISDNSFLKKSLENLMSANKLLNEEKKFYNSNIQDFNNKHKQIIEKNKEVKC